MAPGQHRATLTLPWPAYRGLLATRMVKKITIHCQLSLLFTSIIQKCLPELDAMSFRLVLFQPSLASWYVPRSFQLLHYIYCLPTWRIQALSLTIGEFRGCRPIFRPRNNKHSQRIMPTPFLFKRWTYLNRPFVTEKWSNQTGDSWYVLTLDSVE